ncbi:Helicase associated domain protein [Streptomyces lydicus]|uniref:Helicase associated domain protein n=1 Tax=Streptomyces lydicus TaxID=47763 RepID=UPI001F5069D5|nr:Helicase associated domain protein [Streptomyces lydicus]
MGKLLLAAGALRVTPLQGEMTLSFLERIADRYGLAVRSLLSTVTEAAGQQDVVGALQGDSEVFLNAAARDRVAALCRVPQVGLRRALPAWTREEPLGPSKERPAARLHNGVETVAAWGPACPGCVAARTSRVAPARVYLAAHQRVCPRHRYWLMSVPGSGGRVVGLAGCPEVVQAQEDHRRLLRRSPVADSAFEVAEAVTAWWWAQKWPEETTWPARLCATVPKGEEPGRWRVLARGLVTYPETVGVAGALVDQTMRRHIATQVRGHLPFCLGDLPVLISELARCLRRPWLADRLTSCMDGPLFVWAHQCIKATVVQDSDGQRLLWKVHSAHRPRPLADELALHLQEVAGGEAAGAPPPKRRRGHSRQADEAFEAGLTRARAYAAARGHLATRADTLQDGFPLGAWMTNQRMLRLGMPAWRSAALRALDPYWDTPWPTLWQRTYHQARCHVAEQGPLDARGGFPGTGLSLGEWLYLQCTRYPDLHPEQQRLLARLGIDAAAARDARPRRRSQRAGEHEALAHARAWALEHGSLAGVSVSTVHEDYPLGRWLSDRRGQMGRGVLSPGRAEALTRIDPWWRPPWHLCWQRSYEHACQQLQQVGAGELVAGFVLMDRPAQEWLRIQQRRYHLLLPGQHDLLDQLGLKPETAIAEAPAATASASVAPVRAPGGPQGDEEGAEAVGGIPAVAQHRPLGVPRVGQRPDHRARFDSALVHARAWADVHGHLAVPRDTRQSGFALGMWLFSQRNRAKQRARKGEPASPHLGQLAAIDPWWNPPWDLHWQRNYYRARDCMRAGRGADTVGGLPVGKDALGIWVKRQCTLYDSLHPEQQHLLAAIGITLEAVRARVGPRDSRRLTTTPRFDTDVAHARSYTARYGHLAAHVGEQHEGFPIGRWLAEHRQRARKKSGTSPQARVLAGLDPWWNPPWLFTWQRRYHQYRTTRVAGQPISPELQRWACKQTVLWARLDPSQQGLLTAIGIHP